MGHEIGDRLRDYWTTAEQFLMTLYRNTLQRDQFLHILCFLHFVDNSAETDTQANNCHRLWNIMTTSSTQSARNVMWGSVLSGETQKARFS
jgi:hypothetical protein